MKRRRVLFLTFTLALLAGLATSALPILVFPSWANFASPALNISGNEFPGNPIIVDEEVAPPLDSNAAVVDKVAPAVVSILVESITYDIFLQPVPQQGAGTGIIVSPQGYIVTNNHVVEGANSIKVTLRDGRTFDATIVGTDVWADLAVIRVSGDNLPVADILGDPLGLLRQGDEVMAIGNALALPGGPTVTKGIVSYLGRSIKEPNGIVLYDLIQTDAAINPGNSGGPLVNMAGQVVGINTAIASGAENIGFAISSNSLVPVAEDLIERGYVVRPWLGITMTTVNSAIVSRYGLAVNHGVLVTSVARDSPAEQGRLRVGDVITRFTGQEVFTAEELRRAIQAQQVGAQVEIILVRGSTEKTIHATLGQTPPP